MSPPFDATTFSQYVTDDFNWRVKEISDLKQIIALSGSSYSLVARKAALALIYAHWEGHVRFVTESYLKYIAQRKPKLSKLISAFQAVQLTPHIREWQAQRDSIALRLRIIDTVRDLDGAQFRSVPDRAVATGGNLNYDRFLNLCHLMMLDPSKIVSNQAYLDEEIVGARNRIAHGASMVITEEKIQRAATYVLEIMRLFRTEVENCVALKRYERSPT